MPDTSVRTPFCNERSVAELTPVYAQGKKKKNFMEQEDIHRTI